MNIVERLKEIRTIVDNVPEPFGPRGDTLSLSAVREMDSAMNTIYSKLGALERDIEQEGAGKAALLIEQIEKCEYVCAAGPLQLNVAWDELKGKVIG